MILDVPAGFVGIELDLVERLVYPTSDLIVYVTNCSSTSLLSMARWIETVKAPLDRRWYGYLGRKTWRGSQ